MRRTTINRGRTGIARSWRTLPSLQHGGSATPLRQLGLAADDAERLKRETTARLKESRQLLDAAKRKPGKRWEARKAAKKR